MKEVILDTETTGLSVKDGHRIVEIGCIELENLIPTKNKFHCYLNPERKVSEKALETHGYTDEFLSKKMNFFLKKNKIRKVVILDVPLLLENRINKKNDILIFVQSKKLDILKRLKKRANFNQKLLNKFRKLQLPLDYKKRKSHFIIKNNFTNKFFKKDVKYILKKVL